MTWQGKIYYQAEMISGWFDTTFVQTVYVGESLDEAMAAMESYDFPESFPWNAVLYQWQNGKIIKQQGIQTPAMKEHYDRLSDYEKGFERVGMEE